MKLKSISILFLLFFLINGCSNKTAENVPPEIMAGKDPCDNCFMLINETKYAATVRLENGEAKRFDDIGCLLSYAQKNKKNIKYYWVYDFDSQKPVPAENAFFVKSENLVTPMGSGIIAFSSKEQAGKFAVKDNLSVLNFNELIK